MKNPVLKEKINPKQQEKENLNSYKIFAKKEGFISASQTDIDG